MEIPSYPDEYLEKQEKTPVSENKFKSGDVVMLKSGGPKMTVSTYRYDDKLGLVVRCYWFTTSHRTDYIDVGEDTLTEADPKPVVIQESNDVPLDSGIAIESGASACATVSSLDASIKKACTNLCSNFEQSRLNGKEITLRDKIVKAIDFLSAEAWRIAEEHGFANTSTFIEDLALIHSEVSEALEEVRVGHKPSELYQSNPDKPSKPEGVPAELADVVIRVAQLARHYNIDLADAIVRKMMYNETRPYKHGGKAL